MNSTELHTRYWRLNSDRRFSTPTAALYAYLINWAVQENAPQFALSDPDIITATGIGERTLPGCRQELAERHLIEFQTRRGRGNGTLYTVLDLENPQNSGVLSELKPAKCRYIINDVTIKPAKCRHFTELKYRYFAGFMPGWSLKHRHFAGFISGPVRENFAQPAVFESVEVKKVGVSEANGRDESVNAAPFSPAPPIPLPQSILYNSNRVINNNINNITTAPAHTYTHVHVGAGSERVSLTASTLPDYLTLKGYLPERVGAFVAVHPEQEFLNKVLLISAVRLWLQEQKKAGVIVTTKAQRVQAATLDERKEAFRKELAAWYRAHPDKYDDAMYKEFFAYWTEHKPGAKTMRRDREEDFDIGLRLATCYDMIWLPRKKREERNNGTNTQATTKRPVDFRIDTALENAAESGFELAAWATE